MKTLDYLHLDESAAGKLVRSLQQLLADFQVHYMNLRGFHWNIQGHGFFVLHSKFEEMYDDTAEKVDQIAERILMLGGVPSNKFSEYLKIAKVREIDGVSLELARLPGAGQALYFFDELLAFLMRDKPGCLHGVYQQLELGQFKRPAGHIIAKISAAPAFNIQPKRPQCLQVVVQALAFCANSVFRQRLNHLRNRHQMLFIRALQ